LLDIFEIKHSHKNNNQSLLHAANKRKFGAQSWLKLYFSKANAGIEIIGAACS
jgi:hypothetical protein